MRHRWMIGLLAILAGNLHGAGVRTGVGLTADLRVIEGILPDSDAGGPRVLLIGGLDGSAASAKVVRAELAWYERNAKARKRMVISAIPLANPAKSSLAFPPTGDAYRDNSESYALWRWIAVQAPDLVIVAGADPAGLVDALSREAPAGIGRIPSRRVEPKGKILAGLRDLPGKSEARIEVERRIARTPREVADQAAIVYGHELNEAVYIPAFALMGRLRLGSLQDVERIVAPYREGTRKSLEKPTSSHLSGHLVFADLAERTQNPRYIELVRAAADLAFTPNGEMRESMPMHSQMSDSVFMGCPILVKAGKLTGERRYFDMAVRHFHFMKKLDLRPDGLWRHSPADEAAWGRGNAFALLGMAWSLQDLPKDHPGYEEMLLDFRNLASALGKQQEETGMWRQVVDMAGTYRELSATCMIAASLRKGVRNGWLDGASYQTRVDRAWQAVKARVSSGGKLVDVCESTGAQKTLGDYLKRKAILGVDPRGGAMVLLFATEMLGQ